MRTTTTLKTARRLLGALAAGSVLLAATGQAEAQEILLTGPLAGAPAVRKLRLHREGRFEIAPAVSFSLLDEFQRTIILGARLNYNLTDWFAIGAWGGVGSVIQISTALSDHIQEVNERRTNPAALDRRLTAVNLPAAPGDFRDQLGGLDWVVSPQVTLVPFRGKISLFGSIVADTDLYFFLGPAFVGVSERDDCDVGQCATNFDKASRAAFTLSGGLGLTIYMGQWAALGFDWRVLPFAWNTSGWDVAGRGDGNKFPDQKISSADRQFHMNNLLTVSFNIYLPTEHRLSE